MGLHKFTAETLKDVDFGRPNAAFLLALRRAVADCIDRPADERVRKVTMTLELQPIPEVDGNTVDCTATNGKFKVTCQLPAWETKQVNFGVQANGDLIFSDTSPTDHRQQSLAFGEENDE